MVEDHFGCRLRSAGLRHRVGYTISTTPTTATTTDRLSHLPQPILCHILSFLNTKLVVQTSVLSRVWRSVWKDVPVLHLHRGSFKTDLSFERFVSKVLSHRHHLSLRMVCYVDNSRPWKRKHKSMFVKVLKYGVSYEAEHLMVDIGNDNDLFYTFKSSYLFGSIFKCCNLKTLELRYITLDSGFGWSGLPMLTTLTVDMCLLDTDRDEDLDLFSNMPSLMKLAMSHCFHRDEYGVKRGVKIHGPQLLSLTLDLVDSFKIEIFAPKLKVFILSESFGNFKSKGFPRLTLPSIDRANIEGIRSQCDAKNFKGQVQVEQYFYLLFQGLHNAKTLQLSPASIQILKEICGFLEQQPSPFKRLETLILASDNPPHELINYFFKGSSCKEPKVLIDLGFLDPILVACNTANLGNTE